jgi:hypothetical protein
LPCSRSRRPDRGASASCRQFSRRGRACPRSWNEQKALDYERQANDGGDGTGAPEELRELANDARSQAQLYRDLDAAEQQPRATDAPTPQAQANRSEAETVYDSAERRREKASTMEKSGVEASDVRTRMRVDADQGRSPAEAVVAGKGGGTRAVPAVQGRGTRKNERSR